MTRNFRFGRLLGLIAAGGLAVTSLIAPAAHASNGVSGQGVRPSLGVGNFVAADDDQVCYEIAKLAGYTEQLSSEVRGFKIDPPANFLNEFVSVTLSADGKSLAWSITNARMLAVIVKGGPNYHLYDYLTDGRSLTSDTGLHSPLMKRNVPQVSHYNVCYLPEPQGGAGCTPGFWRNNTPANRPAWSTITSMFDITRGSIFYAPSTTYQQALDTGGGGFNALLRHAAAAHLNAMHPDVSYAYSPPQVRAMFDAAVADPSLIESTKNAFEAENESGCPLSATVG